MSVHPGFSLVELPMRFSLTILVVFSVVTTAARAEDAADVLRRAEATGAALFAAIQAKNLAGPGDIKNFEALQRAIDSQTCTGTTIAWILLPDRNHATEIFGIASAPTKDQLVVGRHFKASVVDGTADLSTLAASTKSCVTLNIQPRAVGLFTTEVISATPTEFHALESKLHGITLYVGAGGQAWSVKDGTISKLEKPAGTRQ
jgi:hypothetical protein